MLKHFFQSSFVLVHLFFLSYACDYLEIRAHMTRLTYSTLLLTFPRYIPGPHLFFHVMLSSYFFALL
jgi:hypothetical protein